MGFKRLYMIREGKYPNVGRIVNVGRFFTWDMAASYMKKHKMSFDKYTIIDGYGIPF